MWYLKLFVLLFIAFLFLSAGNPTLKQTAKEWKWPEAKVWVFFSFALANFFTAFIGLLLALLT